MSARIPSVEEIRSRMNRPAKIELGAIAAPEKKETAVAFKKEVLADVDHKLTSMEAKIKSLSSGRKLTPAEIRESMDLLFQKYDFSPVEELIKMAMSTDDEGRKQRICEFLTEFMIPKLKSIEVKGQVEHNHVVVVRRFGMDGTPRDVPVIRNITPKVTEGARE